MSMLLWFLFLFCFFVFRSITNSDIVILQMINSLILSNESSVKSDWAVMQTLCQVEMTLSPLLFSRKFPLLGILNDSFKKE